MQPFHKFVFLSFLQFLCFQSQSQPLIATVSGYDMHTEVNWNEIPIADRYEIWRKIDGESIYTLLSSTRKLRLQDWTGREDETDEHYSYFVQALNVPGNVLFTSDTLTATVTPLSDDQFLDMVQSYTFRYFYEYGHPISGMARERLGSDDIVTTGGTGFGIMALIVGVHRGYITREEGVNRLLKIVSFLQFADRFHGVFPHWMNGANGDAIPFSTFDNGGDLVETAFLMQGLLAARQYFDQDILTENTLRDVITSLWEEVEWDFYSRNDSGVLYWHWSPEFGWQMNFPIRGYNEGLIVYLLGIASPTHPVDASYYHTGWAGSGYVNGNTWYGHKLFVGPNLGGPLFFAHYSFMGFDPRNIKDQYTNYFEQNRNHTLINYEWCIDNPFNHEGYSAESWGLTASDDPFGYRAHAPGSNADNGTITPAAALPSMPYTPAESMVALKHFYREHGPDLWGEFGFYDAFNLNEDWYADSYLAIDQGPIINMIENHRSGLLWSAFMTNPEIAPALDAIGFVEDPVSTTQLKPNTIDWTVYPTITDREIFITLPNSSTNSSTYHFSISDISGRSLLFDQTQVNEETIRIRFPQNAAYRGWLWVSLLSENQVMQTIPIWKQ